MPFLVTLAELTRFRKALEALDAIDDSPAHAVPGLIGAARKHLRDGFEMSEARQAGHRTEQGNGEQDS
jgi:hypothetical protein